MTEAEWPACTNPYQMLDAVRDASRRRLRLFACAACRRPHVLERISSEHHQILAEIERWVDTQEAGVSGDLASRLADLPQKPVAAIIKQIPESAVIFRDRDHFDRMMTVARQLADARGLHGWIPPPEYEWLREELAATGWGAARLQAAREQLVAWYVHMPPHIHDHFWDQEWRSRTWAPEISLAVEAGKREEEAAYCAFIRDIFTAHLFPVPLDLDALHDGGESACHLARQMYDGEIDFLYFHQVASSLRENGCKDNRLLSHLVSAGPHVRGCWALDLILGKG
jgi:hypothetical protein